MFREGEKNFQTPPDEFSRTLQERLEAFALRDLFEGSLKDMSCTEVSLEGTVAQCMEETALELAHQMSVPLENGDKVRRTPGFLSYIGRSKEQIAAEVQRGVDALSIIQTVFEGVDGSTEPLKLRVYPDKTMSSEGKMKDTGGIRLQISSQGEGWVVGNDAVGSLEIVFRPLGESVAANPEFGAKTPAQLNFRLLSPQGKELESLRADMHPSNESAAAPTTPPHPEIEVDCIYGDLPDLKNHHAKLEALTSQEEPLRAFATFRNAVFVHLLTSSFGGRLDERDVLTFPSAIVFEDSPHRGIAKALTKVLRGALEALPIEPKEELPTIVDSAESPGAEELMEAERLQVLETIEQILPEDLIVLFENEDMGETDVGEGPRPGATAILDWLQEDSSAGLDLIKDSLDLYTTLPDNLWESLADEGNLPLLPNHLQEEAFLFNEQLLRLLAIKKVLADS